jgi:hypothetical protein
MPNIYLPCPISGGCETRITKHTFINACLKYQKFIGQKVGMGQARYRDYSDICESCLIREKVANGEEFDPPNKVTFISLQSIVPTEVEEHKSEGVEKEDSTTAEGQMSDRFVPLSDDEVHHIADLLSKRVPQKHLAEVYKVEPKLIRAIKDEFT